jgi:hypothetical protein
MVALKSNVFVVGIMFISRKEASCYFCIPPPLGRTARLSGAVLSGVYEEGKSSIAFIRLGPDQREDTKRTESDGDFTTSNGADCAVAQCALGVGGTVLVTVLFHDVKFPGDCFGALRLTMTVVDGAVAQCVLGVGDDVTVTAFLCFCSCMVASSK